MNLSLSPKSLFQQEENRVKSLRAISHNSDFLNAASASMAEYAQNHNPTREELTGAREFLKVLLNIAEKETAPERMPVKKLDHSVLEQKV